MRLVLLCLLFISCSKFKDSRFVVSTSFGTYVCETMKDNRELRECFNKKTYDRVDGIFLGQNDTFLEIYKE